jgi:hypothetical protein
MMTMRDMSSERILREEGVPVLSAGRFNHGTRIETIREVVNGLTGEPVDFGTDDKRDEDDLWALLEDLHTQLDALLMARRRRRAVSAD